MGYDMYWVERPEDMETKYNEARQEFQRLVEVRNALPDDTPADEAKAAQEAVEEAYEAMSKEQGYYFRLNIWGMGLCRQLMHERGMLATDDAWGPPWPKREDFGVPEGWTAEEGVEYPPDSPEGKLLAAEKAHIEGDTGGPIPAHKLGSNDGWLVTPDEIKRSLEADQSANGDLPMYQGEPVQWWPEWTSWLKGAIDHGGFRVY